MKVMFAIPSYRGLECGPFVDSMLDTAYMLKENYPDCKLEIVYGHSYVQAARNALVAKFLESDCDRLVFLDEDISWTRSAMIALLTSTRLITAASYPQKTDARSSFPMPVVPVCDESGVPLMDGAYLRATRAMTGFMCIHRYVFSKIKAAFPELVYYVQQEDGSTTEMFDYFPQGVHDHRWLGEDFAFCRLWENLGGEIAVLVDYTFGHHRKDKSWYGNLSRYIQQLPGGGDFGNPEAEKAIWCVDNTGGLVWKNQNIA